MSGEHKEQPLPVPVPRFVDPAGSNYHLQPGSAAIDSGIDAGVMVDVDGQQRPALGGYDIGYDEVQELPLEPGSRLLLPLIRR